MGALRAHFAKEKKKVGRIKQPCELLSHLKTHKKKRGDERTPDNNNKTRLDC